MISSLVSSASETLEKKDVSVDTVPLDMDAHNKHYAELQEEKKDARQEQGKQLSQKMDALNSPEFGPARIDNPKILDLIEEIEFCHMTTKEDREMVAADWRRSIQGQYNEAKEDFDFDPEEGGMGLIYGMSGWDRFRVYQGNVELINSPSLKAHDHALKRAKELGMTIDGSQESLWNS